MSPPTPSPAPRQTPRNTGPATQLVEGGAGPPLETVSVYVSSVNSTDYRDSKYPSPTITDWQNLSVHGNGSMTSEMIRDVIGESCADGDQMED